MCTLDFPRCFLCGNVLSYFPLRRTRELNLICGRCPVDNIAAEQSVLLEMALAATKFPCRYESSGCTEQMYPKQTAEHEENCQFKSSAKKCLCMIVACPVESFCRKRKFCEEELVEHFHGVHSELFPVENTIELQLSASFKRIVLLKHGDHLVFFVTLSAVSKNFLNCVIIPYGHLEDCKDTFARVSVRIADLCLEANVEIFVRATIDLGSLIEDSLSTVFVKIDIFNNAFLCGEMIDAEDILPHLECEICCHLMTPSVFVCVNGHSICPICWPHVKKKCPHCRTLIINQRNLALESVLKLPLL